MKKIYFLLLAVVLGVCSAFAQEPIAKVSEFSNSKTYSISSSRCFLQVIEGGTCLYTSTGTAAGVATEQNATDKNQQFALINGGKNFFLYSVGAGKFIDKSGNYTDEVTSDVVINVVEISSTSSAFPINLNWGDDKYLNTQVQGQTATGCIIDNWTDLDAGNEFAIIEAGTFSDEAAVNKAKAYDSAIIVDTIKYVYMYNGEEVYTYTQVVKGNSPLTVTYDAPGTRVGITCSDATPESKEITENTVEIVTYNFTVDYSALPFVPTTVTDGKFAADTKWYYISAENVNSFCYTKETDDAVYSIDNNGVHVTDPHYLYAFTGDPFAGYEIYNYAKGASKVLYGIENAAAYYSDVAFTAGKSSKFFLEAGTNDGEYRFNKTTNSNCYLYTYQGSVQLFTWSNAATYSECQYYITAATDEEVEKALVGTLSCDPQYANNYVFRNGAAIETLQIMFEGTEADAAIAIAAGMESGKITLQDANGTVVATPKYAVNAEDPTILDVTFDPAFNTEGDYVLVMERGVVKGAVSGKPNNEIKLKYSFQNVAAQIVTARIWKSFSGYEEYGTNWSTLSYTTHADGEYYTCKVKVTGKDTFVLMDWTNDASGDSIKVVFDPSKSSYNCLSFNDKEMDSYSSIWLDTKITLDPVGYNGAYFYPTYSDATFDGSYGMCALSCYNYYSGEYDTYVFADFYMDDRYKYEEIVDGKVCKNPFTELEFTDPTFEKVLPFNSAATYDISVGIVNDSTIVLMNYAGVAGEDLSIVYNPEDGSVISVNNLEIDEYGTSWINSSAFANYYGGWYAYPGNYSLVKYDRETKSGYVAIAGYDYTTKADGDYHNLYVAIGNYAPTDIKTVQNAPATAGMTTIYNLAGQKLSAPRKGVNIINGKKVMY